MLTAFLQQALRAAFGTTFMVDLENISFYLIAVTDLKCQYFCLTKDTSVVRNSVETWYF